MSATIHRKIELKIQTKRVGEYCYNTPNLSFKKLRAMNQYSFYIETIYFLYIFKI